MRHRYLWEMNIFWVLLVLLSLFSFPVFSSNVRIVKDDSKWVLLVDGRPFYIKGAGCGVYKGKNGEDYLLLAKELGANAVRTWGIDQGTPESIWILL